MSSPRPRKSQIAVLIAIIGALLTWYSSRPATTPPVAEETRERAKPVPSPTAAAAQTPAPAARPASFDFYLLSMSLHAAFCADGHGRLPECVSRAPRPLVIHGLWPERRQPGAYPHDCPAARLDLDSALAAELEDYMPGMRSGLHEHEWRTHGGCAGLDDDEYFHAALALARTLDAALAAKLTTLAGRETSARELRDAADQYQSGLGATLVFQCRTLRGAPAAQRKRAFVVEVRQCVDDDGVDGAPGTALDCATVGRRDQGCGGSFLVAGPKLWK